MSCCACHGGCRHVDHEHGRHCPMHELMVGVTLSRCDICGAYSPFALAYAHSCTEFVASGGVE
jgi:hypothetical protein